MTKPILGLLQNQWFYPESLPRVERCYADACTPEARAALNARFLFMGSKTGRTLAKVFGCLCDVIIWEEASKSKAQISSGAFKPDVDHIVDIIKHFKPGIVLTFGKPALAGLTKARTLITPEENCFDLIPAPHPVARGIETMNQLLSAATQLVDLLEPRVVIEDTNVIS